MKNSFEILPDGGELIISTHLIEHANSEYAEIILRDTGHEIEADNPGDIFIP